MKILIVSTARSGSTSLLKSFSNSFSHCLEFDEPLNSGTPKTHNYPFHLEYNNMIVKFLSNQIPSNCYNFLDKDKIYIKALKFFTEEVIPKFQKIILLTRLDDYKAIESYYFASSTQNWHSHYSLKTKIPYEIIPNLLNHFIFTKSIIYGLSNTLNIPITYYEDLFNGNKIKVKEFLNLNQLDIPNFNQFYSYLDPRKKYRQN